MDPLLKDILKYTETGETIRVTKDSIIQAIDPIKSARGNQLAETLASFLRDTDPWKEFIKWCEYFDLEYREPHDMPYLILIRKKPAKPHYKAF